MRRLTGWVEKWVPRYAVLPLIAIFLFNVVVYEGSKLIMAGAPHYDLSLPLDHRLPYVPSFYLIYFLAFVSWAAGFVLIFRESPEHCGKVMMGELIAKLLCLVFYLVLPTRIVRPEPEGSGVFALITRLTYFFDTPDTLFPSVHCLESWLCWRGMFGCKSLGRGVKGGFLVIALLVFLSTLLVKQHVLVDIPSAMLVGEIGLLLSSRLRLGERYAAWCRRRGVIA